MLYTQLLDTVRTLVPTLARTNDSLKRLMTQTQEQCWNIWQAAVKDNKPFPDDYVLRAVAGTDISDHLVRALRDYGGKVFIQAVAGEYKISKRINLPTGARIRSNGAAVHLEHQTLALVNTIDHNKHGLVIPLNASNVIIDGLRFTGKHVLTDWTNGQQAAVWVEAYSNNTGHDLNIARCWFENLTGFSVQCYEHFDRFTYIENVMANCGNGLNTSASHHTIADNVVIGSEAFECAVLDTLNIERNLILSTRLGVSIGGHMGGAELLHQSARDNVVIQCTEGGYPYSAFVVADGSVGAVIDSNTVFGWGGAVILTHAAQTGQFVRDTIIRNNHSYGGLTWQIYMVNLPDITNTQVLSNYIRDGAGVRFNHTGTVRGNVVENGSGQDYYYDSGAVVQIADNCGAQVTIQSGAQVTNIE